MRKLHVLLAALLIVAWGTSAGATVFSGRASLSSYLWSYREVDSTDTRHLQNTGALSLRLGQIAGQDLEILTSLRGRLDVRNAGDNLSDYHVYDLQARWKNIAKVIDLTGGRHRVYWPNGTVSIDGGSATIHPVRGLEAGGYFGLIAPEDGRFKTTTYDKGHAFGAQLGYHSTFAGDVVASFAQKNVARVYGADSVNSLASRTLGIDWKRTVTGFGSLYGQMIYQLPTEKISRVQFSARWRASDKLSLNAQFRYRRPDLAYNSIFWVFGDSRYYEGRVQASYRINPTWGVNAGVVYVDLVGDNAERIELGVSHRYFSLTLNGKTGGSGKTIGASGEALYPINNQWTLRGGAHLSSYELVEDAPESNFEASLWAGGTWNWTTQSTLDAEVQYVMQNIKAVTNYGDGSGDVRFILRLSWWFFSRWGSHAG